MFHFIHAHRSNSCCLHKGLITSSRVTPVTSILRSSQPLLFATSRRASRFGPRYTSLHDEMDVVAGNKPRLWDSKKKDEAEYSKIDMKRAKLIAESKDTRVNCRHFNDMEALAVQHLMIRASATQGRDTDIFKDPKSVELVSRIRWPFAQFAEKQVEGKIDISIPFVAKETIEVDDRIRSFLNKDGYSNSLIIEIGIGLDTRFDRIDNGECYYSGIDTSNIINARQSLGLDKSARENIFVANAFQKDCWHQLRSHAINVLGLLGEKTPIFEKVVVCWIGSAFYSNQRQLDQVMTRISEYLPGSTLMIDTRRFKNVNEDSWKWVDQDHVLFKSRMRFEPTLFKTVEVYKLGEDRDFVWKHFGWPMRISSYLGGHGANMFNLYTLKFSETPFKREKRIVDEEFLSEYMKKHANEDEPQEQRSGRTYADKFTPK